MIDAIIPHLPIASVISVINLPRESLVSRLIFPTDDGMLDVNWLPPVKRKADEPTVRHLDSRNLDTAYRYPVIEAESNFRLTMGCYL